MMAAYAGGDQERAVRAYVDTRSALSDDLGVEPLPETQSLYLAILRHESPTSLLPDDLRRTEPGFRRLADQQAAQGWWTTDPALNVTSVVGEPGRFIGVDRRQMEGRTAEDVSVRVGIPGIVSDHRRALAGEPVTREIAVGGQTYAVHLEPMRHGSEVVGVVGVSMDVTGREQAAAILEDETSTAGADRDDPEDRNGMDDDVEAVLQDLRDVLDRSSDALLVVDPWADLILAANEAAAELLGHQRDELMRRRPSDLHRGEMGAFLGFMERVDDEGFGWTDDLSCATGDGRLLRVAIASRRLTFHRRRAVLSLLRPIERGRERDPRLLAKLRVAGEG
jgi:PAS domain-containing protein